MPRGSIQSTRKPSLRARSTPASTRSNAATGTTTPAVRQPQLPDTGTATHLGLRGFQRGSANFSVCGGRKAPRAVGIDDPHISHVAKDSGTHASAASPLTTAKSKAKLRDPEFVSKAVSNLAFHGGMSETAACEVLQVRHQVVSAARRRHDETGSYDYMDAADFKTGP